jgi:hypothetical protein
VLRALLAAAALLGGDPSPAERFAALLVGEETAAPAAAPPPKAEEIPKPPPARTSPEAAAVLARAAARQGTAAHVGPKAPTRFQAFFPVVEIRGDDGGGSLSDVTESFALPPAGSKEGARFRSAYRAEGERQILGHNGRFGWRWTETEGTHAFTDPDADAADIREVEDRRRFLRLALRIFFLGNLVEHGPAVVLGADETRAFPTGKEGKSTPPVACRVLERAAAPDEGEPALRIYLDAKTLDPVAVALLPAKPEDPTWLLTLSVTPGLTDLKVPEGVRVPDWLELFEVPAAKDGKPAVRVRAGLQTLTVDPAAVPDDLFKAPKATKPTK